ncbi:hypothetical protein [Micromonospora kangleipakensis]|uniref:hypothetical protein n=1 Tax=Micromonospora kangleipakensis TaxID=1077942 RepID=UPI0010291ABB|nr:hypothetical protein [Micromonospora kangleipakensis]
MSRGRLPSDTEEIIISAEPGIPNLAELREEIERDRVLLGSLPQGADEYRRLRRKITRNTAKLHEYEELGDRRRVEVGYTGLLFVLVGGIVTCAGWGSWWVLLGFGMLLLGVYWADRLRPSRDSRLIRG